MKYKIIMQNGKEYVVELTNDANNYWGDEFVFLKNIKSIEVIK